MTYLILLRLLHIVCGVFWAGATLYLAGFIIPAVKALGPDGGKFMQQLSRTNKLPVVMNIAGSLTVLCGILLIERLSGTFQLEWFTSQHGMLISIGGTIGLIAYVLGISVSLPTIIRMAAIGKIVAVAGGPPTPEQMQELQKLRNRLFTATNVIAILLLGSVILMSIARYY